MDDDRDVRPSSADVGVVPICSGSMSCTFHPLTVQRFSTSVAGNRVPCSSMRALHQNFSLRSALGLRLCCTRCDCLSCCRCSSDAAACYFERLMCVCRSTLGLLIFAGEWPLYKSVKICFACGGRRGTVTVAGAWCCSLLTRAPACRRALAGVDAARAPLQTLLHARVQALRHCAGGL